MTAIHVPKYRQQIAPYVLPVIYALAGIVTIGVMLFLAARAILFHGVHR